MYNALYLPISHIILNKEHSRAFSHGHNNTNFLRGHELDSLLDIADLNDACSFNVQRQNARLDYRRKRELNLGEGGKLAELVPLLTIMTFVGSFVLLTSLIPAALIGASPNMQGINVPTEYEAFDIILYNSTSFPVNFTKYKEDYPSSWGYWGDTIDVGETKILLGSYNTTNFKGYEPFFLAVYYIYYPLEYEQMTWKIGTDVFTYKFTYDEMDDLAVKYEQLEFHVTYAEVSRTVLFNWNSTLYAKPSQACEVDAMTLVAGMTWDEMQTKTNAWTILGQLLFFQMPDIHWSINALIAIPIWIGIVYLLFAFVTKLIPFL